MARVMVAVRPSLAGRALAGLVLAGLGCAGCGRSLGGPASALAPAPTAASAEARGSAVAPAVQPPAADPVEPDGGAAAPADPGAIRWRFRAGSPSPGLVVAADGSVYVPTFEGHLQALSAEGALRWAYNTGTPAAGAVVRSDGVVFVGTQAAKIFALRPDGSLLWTFSAPLPLVTGLTLDAIERVVFGDRSGAVVAIDGRGAVRARWPLPGGIDGPLVPVPGGGIVAAGRDGRVTWVGNGPPRSLELGARTDAPLEPGPGGSLLALAGGRLRVIRDGEVALEVPRVVATAAARDRFVTLSDDGTLVLRADDGTPERTERLCVTPSAPPVLASTGEVLIPSATGELWIVSAAGVRRVPVAGAPLTRPVLFERRRRVLVASGDGTVAAIALSGDD